MNIVCWFRLCVCVRFLNVIVCCCVSWFMLVVMFSWLIWSCCCGGWLLMLCCICCNGSVVIWSLLCVLNMILNWFVVCWCVWMSGLMCRVCCGFRMVVFMVLVIIVIFWYFFVVCCLMMMFVICCCFGLGLLVGWLSWIVWCLLLVVRICSVMIIMWWFSMCWLRCWLLGLVRWCGSSWRFGGGFCCGIMRFCWEWCCVMSVCLCWWWIVCVYLFFRVIFWFLNFFCVEWCMCCWIMIVVLRKCCFVLWVYWWFMVIVMWWYFFFVVGCRLRGCVWWSWVLSRVIVSCFVLIDCLSVRLVGWLNIWVVLRSNWWLFVLVLRNCCLWWCLIVMLNLSGDWRMMRLISVFLLWCCVWFGSLFVSLIIVSWVGFMLILIIWWCRCCLWLLVRNVMKWFMWCCCCVCLKWLLLDRDVVSLWFCWIRFWLDLLIWWSVCWGNKKICNMFDGDWSIWIFGIGWRSFVLICVRLVRSRVCGWLMNLLCMFVILRWSVLRCCCWRLRCWVGCWIICGWKFLFVIGKCVIGLVINWRVRLFWLMLFFCLNWLIVMIFRFVCSWFVWFRIWCCVMLMLMVWVGWRNVSRCVMRFWCGLIWFGFVFIVWVMRRLRCCLMMGVVKMFWFFWLNRRRRFLLLVRRYLIVFWRCVWWFCWIWGVLNRCWFWLVRWRRRLRVWSGIILVSCGVCIRFMVWCCWGVMRRFWRCCCCFLRLFCVIVWFGCVWFICCCNGFLSVIFGILVGVCSRCLNIICRRVCIGWLSMLLVRLFVLCCNVVWYGVLGVIWCWLNSMFNSCSVIGVLVSCLLGWGRRLMLCCSSRSCWCWLWSCLIGWLFRVVKMCCVIWRKKCSGCFRCWLSGLMILFCVKWLFWCYRFVLLMMRLLICFGSMLSVILMRSSNWFIICLMFCWFVVSMIRLSVLVGFMLIVCCWLCCGVKLSWLRNLMIGWSWSVFVNWCWKFFLVCWEFIVCWVRCWWSRIVLLRWCWFISVWLVSWRSCSWCSGIRWLLLVLCVIGWCCVRLLLVWVWSLLLVMDWLRKIGVGWLFVISRMVKCLIIMFGVLVWWLCGFLRMCWVIVVSGLVIGWCLMLVWFIWFWKMRRSVSVLFLFMWWCMFLRVVVICWVGWWMVFIWVMRFLMFFVKCLMCVVGRFGCIVIVIIRLLMLVVVRNCGWFILLLWYLCSRCCVICIRCCRRLLGNGCIVCVGCVWWKWWRLIFSCIWMLLSVMVCSWYVLV